MPSKLEQLREMTLVVADSGDIEAVKRLKPVDCTTNPSLVLKAVGLPLFAEKFDEALDWGRSQNLDETQRVVKIGDRLAISVGTELTKLVKGRVSTEVDADLSFDTEGSVKKAHEIIEEYEARGVSKDRILVKLGSTWEGIRAAEQLQKAGIDCNMTLIFNKAQAMAAADAGAFLISPFVGRILDWHAKASGKTFTATEDPGVLSVQDIYRTYKAHGIETVVMGASFRNTGEIEELAGCDRLTISPALLDELDKDQGKLERKLSPESSGGAKPERVRYDEKSFRWAMNEDAMATEKLAEGIRQFNADLIKMRQLISERLGSGVREAAE
ncbi:transaldolase [Aureimonas leprariae]|uniref:Transaldolase n=1 Tax=Plantimonas leprariae TaxID=2615207 RepID=A0A7V7PRE1_9HYPH|nr:transaldolase [Aureimonas leprariae]KAB0681267.1 transaldolase [Aureimonas leprariae]